MARCASDTHDLPALQAHAAAELTICIHLLKSHAQKNRALICNLKQSFFSLFGGTGKCAVHVTKLADFPAGLAGVHRSFECNERLIAPAACIVDALCKNFLSGACLTHRSILESNCRKGPRFSLPDGWRQIHRSDSGRCSFALCPLI